MQQWVAQAAQDFRLALRTLGRRPGLTASVVITLALGIGANTAVFSLVNPLLLRPLPFPDADRLVWVGQNPDGGFTGETGQVAALGQTYRVAALEEFTRGVGAFEALSGYFAYFGYEGVVLGTGPDAERVDGTDVAPGFLELLGVTPALGRLFLPDEVTPDGPDAVVISDGLWQRRFARDPGVIGRTVAVNGRPATITGVLPASFDFGSVFAPGSVLDVFTPMDLERRRPQGNLLAMVGRLRPDVSIAGAQAELDALTSRLPEESGATRAFVSSLGSHVTGPVRQPLLILWAAAALMLLVVCANLSGLLLARTGERAHEVAIRLALGSGRARVLRQLLTESVVLGLAGAAAGLAIAVTLVRSARSTAGLGLPLLGEVQMDTAALVFTAGIAVTTGLLVGLLPAIRVSGQRPQAALVEQTRGGTGGGGRARMHAALVVAEVALACLLMVGASLLVRSFVRLLDVDLGFAPSNAVALRVEPPAAADPTARVVLLDDLTRRIVATAGVEAAGLTDALPLGRNRGWGISPVGSVSRENDGAFVYVIGTGYLDAMGIPLREGRAFADLDRRTDDRLVIINETLARTYWPNHDATGRQVIVDGQTHRVLGVAADVRQESLEAAAGYQVYLPYWQAAPAPSMDLIVRSALPPETLAPLLRAAARDAGGLVVTDLRPVGTFVESVVGPRRFLVTLLGAFALLALALACLGVYSVAATSVDARVREFGIRMALGAPRAAVLRSVMAGIGALALAGLALGLGAAAAGARYLSVLLYDLETLDPATFLAVPLAVLAVTTLAVYLPARRATRIDPIDAMRDQ
jgi:predicted permease